MNRAIIAVIVSIASAACGDATGASYPDIRGDYNPTYRYVEIIPSTGQSASVVCLGTFAVTSQKGARFAGRFAVQPTGACIMDVSGTLSGDMRSDGKLTFHTAETGTSKNAVEMITSCPVTSGSDEFQGVLLQNTMTASMVATVSCPTGAAPILVELQFHIVAVKP